MDSFRAEHGHPAGTAAVTALDTGHPEPGPRLGSLHDITANSAATRRALLRLTGVAGVSLLSGCIDHPSNRTTRSTPQSASGRVLIFLTTPDGVSVFDEHGQVVAPPTVVTTGTPDWAHAVIAEPDGTGTRVVVRDLASDRLSSVTTLPDRLEPRIVSATGHLVASVTRGGAGSYGLHKPGGRQRTTVVVSGGGQERVRLDLAGTCRRTSRNGSGYGRSTWPPGNRYRWSPGTTRRCRRVRRSNSAPTAS